MERIHHIPEIASYYIRQPNPGRQTEGWRLYKKGMGDPLGFR